jgi:hypothetical protein
LIVNKNHDVDANDMMPQAEDLPAADAMEETQKVAAEERLEGGGYGG